LIRAIGTIHEKTGQQCVATGGRTFLKKPRCYLWHLAEPDFQYSPPKRFPLPRRTDFAPQIARLLVIDTPTPGDDKSERSTESVPYESGVSFREGGRIPRGVAEGHRNTAALYVSHEMFRQCPSAKVAWRMLQRWNRRNDPPLSERELRGVFEKVNRWRRGRVP
jgi:hypothetical protein